MSKLPMGVIKMHLVANRKRWKGRALFSLRPFFVLLLFFVIITGTHTLLNPESC
jgi:hypothetical protein